MDVDNAPREIWIPTYGTDSLFDDWFADPDMASEDDVKYIRADITGAEIRRLEDIIAQMSDELVDAWEACEEAVSKVVEWQTSYQSLNAIRHKIVEEREYWQEMYQNTSEALRKTGDRLLKAIDGGAL
jgi:hypothetical protein